MADAIRSGMVAWGCIGEVELSRAEPGRESHQSVGSLVRIRFAGGMYMFKIICRQILALLLLLRKHGVAARHLQLSDILISRDGLASSMGRKASVAVLHSGRVVLRACALPKAWLCLWCLCVFLSLVVRPVRPHRNRRTGEHLWLGRPADGVVSDTFWSEIHTLAHCSSAGWHGSELFACLRGASSSCFCCVFCVCPESMRVYV